MFKEWLHKQTMDRAERLKKDGINYSTKNYLFDRLKLKDGTSMSVQASRNHLCEPLKTIMSEEDGDYTEVEIYADKSDFSELADRGETSPSIYGYVEVELLEELVKNHGGILEEESNE